MFTFQVWHETSYGKGATNFLPGMGAFLQSLIYGYGGLRYHDNHLELNPTLPPDTKELHLTDLNYLGSSFSVFVGSESVRMIITHQNIGVPQLKLYLDNPEQVLDLKLRRTVEFAPRKALIVPIYPEPKEDEF